MPITIEAKDKRIKQLIQKPTATSIKGLQPFEVNKIRARLNILQASTSIYQFKAFDPNWRVHEWEGTANYWSCDVTGNYRLLFDFDPLKLIASNMIYHDPH